VFWKGRCLDFWLVHASVVCCDAELYLIQANFVVPQVQGFDALRSTTTKVQSGKAGRSVIKVSHHTSSRAYKTLLFHMTVRPLRS
jgi:hypothetical protein